MEEFISWTENQTSIKFGTTVSSGDKYHWFYFYCQDWISSKDSFDTKLDALKDFLTKIDSIILGYYD